VAVAIAGVLAAVAVVAVHYLTEPAVVPSSLITTLQKGEYGSVPDACRAVTAPVLTELLGGAPKIIRPQLGQCTFTVDAQPRFRELTVRMQALVPNAGYGNGSATANASYNFSQQRAQLSKPPKHTPQPAATITPVGGLGDKAFVAVQVFRASVITNEVTVLVRYQNVLITAYVQAEISDGFGPAPISQLRVGALAVARALLTAVKAEPAVG